MEETEIKNIPNTPTESKYSYEQLEEIVRRAAAENMKLRQAVNALSENRGIKRLEFLFNVLDHQLTFESDTITKATKEITEALFPPQEEKNNSEIPTVENE